MIQPWVGGEGSIGAGSLVIVDNANGKFTTTPGVVMSRPTERPMVAVIARTLKSVMQAS